MKLAGTANFTQEEADTLLRNTTDPVITPATTMTSFLLIEISILLIKAQDIKHICFVNYPQKNQTKFIYEKRKKI